MHRYFFVIMLMLMFSLFTACDSDSGGLSNLETYTPVSPPVSTTIAMQTPEPALASTTVTTQAPSPTPNTNRDGGELQERIEAISAKHLTTNMGTGGSTISIKSFTVFDFSAEGASFLAIFGDCGRLEYLGVDIFGEMGRISHSYTFTEQFIVYSVVEVAYAEPFFINPTDIPISNVYDGRYMLLRGSRVYRLREGEENLAIDEEFSDAIIERLVYFLNTLNTQLDG